MDSKTQKRLYLVTGASGYVGGRLVRDLLSDKKRVRVFVRDAKKIQGQSWAASVEIIEGNASNAQDLDRALVGVNTAYYLLHSINAAADFGDIEAVVNGNFTGGVTVFDLSVDGVGYSTTGGYIDDIVDELEAYKAQIISGEITVPATP